MECLDMTQETYDTLTTSAASCLKWFCDKCDKVLAAKKDDDNKSEDILKVLEQLVEGTKAVERRLDSIEHVLDSKADKEYVHSLENRLTSVETRVQDIQQMSTWSDMKVKYCIAKAIESKQGDESVEKEEREKIKTSVIIHGIAESSSDEAKDREEDDMGVLASMLHEMSCDQTEIIKVVRLGKRPIHTDTENAPKPRPIKMVVKSEEQKVNVLKAAKNLRQHQEGGWEKIFIHQDLTISLIIIGNKIVKRYGWRQRQASTIVDKKEQHATKQEEEESTVAQAQQN